MPLTDAAIRNAKPREKPYKLSDERGLYLLVKQTGKYFRLDYRVQVEQKIVRKTLALGVYPEVTLSEARQKRNDARKLLAKNIDPGEHKKKEKRNRQELAENTFESIALAWFDKRKPEWVEAHASRVMGRLERDVFPFIGKRPIKLISARELLDEVLKRMEERGVYHSAHRVNQICGQVFRFAVTTGKADHNPSAALKGALTSAKVKNMPSLTEPIKIGGLLRAIDGYDGQITTQCALKLAPMVFLRPGELRKAEWSEIDLENAQWKIPAEKMKMRSPHIVPLSRQAIAIFKTLQPITGAGRWVFPSLRPGDRPMSDNTINAALRRMGYAPEEMVAHGFRGMASTLLHEQGWPTDVIERQLAHTERNSVKAAYNHAEHLPKRKKMMQAWADFLDSLKAGGKVIPIRRARV